MSVTNLEGDDLFNRWAKGVIAASTMLDDCKNTCPAWFKGNNWRWLRQTYQTLTCKLTELEPCVEFSGFELYMEVAQ